MKDLYRLVNGPWIDTHTIPADRGIDGVFHQLRDQAERDVREIVESGSGRATDLFRSFTDIPGVTAAGIEPLHEDFALIDAATWLPPNAAFRCEYVQRQIEVKANYGLWVTPPEKETMARVLASCGQQQVPADPIPAPSQEDSNVLYPDCKAARAASAAPIYRGQPGYRPEMDGDGDGIACESAR